MLSSSTSNQHTRYHNAPASVGCSFIFASGTWVLLLFCLLALPYTVARGDDSANDHPRIGLVLGGGGAKGAAHVGVIKILEEIGVRVDIVVGTSMGAIVGGLYASGLGAGELERAIEQIDWVDIFDDDPPRAQRSFRRKQDDSDVLIRYRVGVKDGAVRLPDGIIIGQKLGLVLRRLTAHVSEQTNFDHLSLPYRAVATDLETGEAVVLASGSLARAMHASMSVPGVFPPVEYGERLLVDGGLANNLPVDVARAMGAEQLIVVNVGTEPLPREALTGAVNVAEQALNIVLERETRRQLATLEPHDILIKPLLGDLSAADFERSREAVDIGAAAARKQIERLATLAGAPVEQTATRVAADTKDAPLIITSIHIDNETPLNDDVLVAKLSQRQGDEFHREQLERDISDIYGLGYFETVDYRVERSAQGVDLFISARERAIGLKSLRFGLTLESDFSGDSAFNFVTESQMLGVNSLGGEVRSALVFGQDVFVGAEFFQPLDVDQRWFVEPAAIYRQSNVGVFEDGDRIADFRVERSLARFDLGRAFTSCCEVRGSLQFGVGDARRETGSPQLAGGTFQIGSAVFSAGYDTLDNSRFPRHGSSLALRYEHELRALGADTDAQRLEINGVVAKSTGAHTVLARTEMGIDLGGQQEVQGFFSLGGLFNLSGFSRNEVSAENKALAGIIYYYELSDLPSFDFGIPLFLGASLEYGGVYEHLDDFSSEDHIAAGAAFVGADTPLGPFYLGYGAAEGGNRSLYLFLGQNF